MGGEQELVRPVAVNALIQLMGRNELPICR